MINRFLPPELETVVGAEKIEFSVVSKRNKPIGQAAGTLIFGVIWSAITSIFVVAFFGPLFKGEEVEFGLNGEMVTASLDNLEPILVPALIIGVFVLIGIIALLVGIYQFFQTGGYFAATATRLLHYRKGNIATYDWAQFTGNVKMNAKRGNITLQLRSGYSTKNGGFVHNVVFISGADNVLEIEKICRKRIKEVVNG
jgi:hypothetical protein